MAGKSEIQKLIDDIAVQISDHENEVTILLGMKERLEHKEKDRQKVAEGKKKMKVEETK